MVVTRDINKNNKKAGFVEKLYNCILFSAATVFFGYVTMRMVFPLLKSRVNPLRGFTAILFFFLCFLVIWALDRFLIRKMNTKTAVLSVVLLVSANVALQLFCLNNLKVKPSWDFGAIMIAADDISIGRPIRNWVYFQEYPYNINPAVIVGTFKFLLGGNQLAPYTLNVISVTASIAGACLLAYRSYGRRAAVLAALFFLAVTPLYLYIPIVYTDTLSMPFVIWSVYAWTKIRSSSCRAGKVLPYCIWIGLLSAMGFMIKQIAAIGLAAFTIDYVIGRTGYKPGGYRSDSLPEEHQVNGPSNGPHLKKFLSGMIIAVLPLAAAFLSFFLTASAFRIYVDYKGFDSRLDSSKSLPFTHWLMMGLNTPYAEGGTSSGYGGFSAEDLKYSRIFKTSEEKKAAEVQMISSRLQQYGIDGYTRFLLKKIEWTWTDGTYYAPVKLGRYPVKRTILHKIVLLSNGKSNRLYRILTQLVQTVILSMILIGCIVSLKKGPDRSFRLMTLMCLGLAVFLLLWETRSRYLTFMLPVFVVMAVYGMLLSFKAIDKAAAYLYSTLKSFI